MLHLGNIGIVSERRAHDAFILERAF